jgi:choline dehydrogenase-like flavoprotein
MERRHTDVLVIGSGFGAAAPALRLAAAGMRVTLLEKGARFGPGDYRQTQDPKYLLRFLKSLSSDHMSLTYAEALGGGSGFYEMVSLRAPSLAFEQHDDGRRLWPASLTRSALDPWYERAEAMLGVEQIPETEVPKSGQVFSLLMRRMGLGCDRARYAVRNCRGSGFCVTGCIFGAKQSLHLNYLPQAVAAGAEIVCDAEALAIMPLEAYHAARADAPLHTSRYAVRCRLGGSKGDLVEYRASLVILAGGCVGTARLLLASRAHLRYLSPQAGANIAFNGGVKLAVILPDDMPDADMYVGRSHPGVISYSLLATHGATICTAKPLPLQMLAAGRLRRAGAREWWGAAHVNLMRQARHRMMVVATLGLTPPAGRITLDADGSPRLSLDDEPRLAQHEHDIESLLRRRLLGAGCTMLELNPVDRGGQVRRAPWFTSAHQVGSCRMANSPTDGVTNPEGEVFNYPGLYVTDGASVPSSLAVNTSLTILANAERIADGIVRRFQHAA